MVNPDDYSVPVSSMAANAAPAAGAIMPAKDDLTLSLDAFIRSVGVRRATPHTLFLGAGASVSSGVPSAQGCIWEWKRNLFLTSNPGLENQFSELSLPSVQRRIQHWLDKQGIYPKEGTAGEYGFYIRKCFPIADDRRAYFQEKVRGCSRISATGCYPISRRPTSFVPSGPRISTG
jgi:hypothetical protein